MSGSDEAQRASANPGGADGGPGAQQPNSRLQIGALLAGIALLVLGNGLQGTLIGVRAGLENMGSQTIGMVMSAYFVGYVASSLLVPRLVQEVGHIRTFAALASVASAVSLAFAIIVSPATWIVLRIIHGACYAGLVIVIESWLNIATERNSRGRVLAVYGVVVYGAWAASQPLLNLSAPSGFVLFCLVSICLSLALVPITLMRATAPGVVEVGRASMRRLFKISPVGIVGAFAVGLVTSAFFGMAPTFAQRIGMENGEIAAFLGVTMIGALALQWPLGWLSDHIDRRLVILGVAFGTCASALGLAWNTDGGMTTLLLLSFSLGAFALPTYSLCVAHANDGIDATEVVSVSSGLILVFGLGSTVGPFTASLVMEAMGPGGLFLFMASVALVLALYDMFGLVTIPKIAERRKSSFVAMPQTSHAATRLHKHRTGKDSGRVAPQ